ncbi:hypothetical protein CICLE_v10027326mg [Citrus x clementina]|uniref:Uncharacterized protein n=2 Tax=Citrus clementina TaxID=85681 RepID=V4SVU2_CITCL|nr:hypothetical protein CICLE_v10027326mg [Citrus x clementina]GAY44292.1 hypothetical protein CUMW_081080 [Citrus unshiu]
MLDFGEELTRETLKIPWLIWIQIIVLLLLVILLYCFSLFPLDLSQEGTCNNTNTSTTLPSSSSSSSAPVVLKQNTTTFRNHLQPSQCFLVGKAKTLLFDLKAVPSESDLKKLR